MRFAHRLLRAAASDKVQPRRRARLARGARCDLRAVELDAVALPAPAILVGHSPASPLVPAGNGAWMWADFKLVLMRYAPDVELTLDVRTANVRWW